MVQISFPLYLITDKSAIEVSALDLARFVNGPKWLTTPDGNGIQHLALFTTEQNARDFISMTDSPDRWWPLEMCRRDLILALETLDQTQCPRVALDLGTNDAPVALIENALVMFREMKDTEASDSPRTDLGGNRLSP